MTLTERTQLILASMEQSYGHEWIAEAVQQRQGSPEFIPLWNAYRERDAEAVLHELDKLCTSYWTPCARNDAEASEVEEEHENRYRRKAALI